MHFFSASENVKLFYTGAINSNTWSKSIPCYCWLFTKNKHVGFIYGIPIRYAITRWRHNIRPTKNIEHFTALFFRNWCFCPIRTGIPGVKYPPNDRRKNRQTFLMNFSPSLLSVTFSIHTAIFHTQIFNCHESIPYFCRQKTLDPGLNATKPQAGRNNGSGCTWKKKPIFHPPLYPLPSREGRLGCCRKSRKSTGYAAEWKLQIIDFTGYYF